MLWLKLTEGVAELRLEVLVSDQTRSWFDCRGPTATPLPWASSAAFELRKYSVPPLALELMSFGAVAGQIVKPALPPTTPSVSISSTAMEAGCRASACLEMA